MERYVVRIGSRDNFGYLHAIPFHPTYGNNAITSVPSRIEEATQCTSLDEANTLLEKYIKTMYTIGWRKGTNVELAVVKGLSEVISTQVLMRA